MDKFIIYGAYGYTGSLIVELAVSKGLKPTVAGRNLELVKALAEKHDLPYLCFAFDDQKAWDKALEDQDLLLNCAGPFSITIKEILSACIRNKTHYTDITGEIEVFEFIQEHHEQAKQNGIVLLPGTGFDVVPTDCLAKYLHEQLPTATHLEMAFESTSGLSRGTALSVLKRIHQGSATREEGVIKVQPTASSTRTIHYGGKDRFSVGIAWGDVFTSFNTTGIPNVEVFTGMPVKTMKIMRQVGKWGWLIKTGLVQYIGRYLIRKKITGPSKDKRENLSSYLWGRVYDSNGNEVHAQMETPESYKLTAITAMLCAEKILAGKAKPGFNTPAGAFGSELIMEVVGVKRQLI